MLQTKGFVASPEDGEEASEKTGYTQKRASRRWGRGAGGGQPGAGQGPGKEQGTVACVCPFCLKL